MSISQTRIHIQQPFADVFVTAGRENMPVELHQFSPSGGGSLRGLWRQAFYVPSIECFPPQDTPAVVRVGSLWLPQETLHLNRHRGTQSPLEIARDAVARGLSQITQSSQDMFTQHALMVVWGEFAHEIGIISKFRRIPIPQKSVVHTPQAKVLTFLMGTLCGITHLKDLNEGPHPLAHDLAAIRAWGLVALSHYSGVSR